MPRKNRGLTGRNRFIFYAQRRIPVPDNNDEKIYFPYGKFTGKFHTEDYSPSMTNGRLGEDELKEFLEEVRSLILEWQCYPGQKIICLLGLLLFLYAMGAGVGIAFILSSNHENENASMPITVPIIIGGFVVVFLLFFVFLCVWSCKKRSKLVECVKKITNLFEQKASYFKQKGLSWKLPMIFPTWIELHVNEMSNSYNNVYEQNYTTQGNFGPQTTTMPQDTSYYPNDDSQIQFNGFDKSFEANNNYQRGVIRLNPSGPMGNKINRMPHQS